MIAAKPARREPPNKGHSGSHITACDTRKGGGPGVTRAGCAQCRLCAICLHHLLAPFASAPRHDDTASPISPHRRTRCAPVTVSARQRPRSPAHVAGTTPGQQLVGRATAADEFLGDGDPASRATERHRRAVVQHPPGRSAGRPHRRKQTGPSHRRATAAQLATRRFDEQGRGTLRALAGGVGSCGARCGTTALVPAHRPPQPRAPHLAQWQAGAQHPATPRLADPRRAPPHRLARRGPAAWPEHAGDRSALRGTVRPDARDAGPQGRSARRLLDLPDGDAGPARRPQHRLHHLFAVRGDPVVDAPAGGHRRAVRAAHDRGRLAQLPLLRRRRSAAVGQCGFVAVLHGPCAGHVPAELVHPGAVTHALARPAPCAVRRFAGVPTDRPGGHAI